MSTFFTYEIMSPNFLTPLPLRPRKGFKKAWGNGVKMVREPGACGLKSKGVWKQKNNRILGSIELLTREQPENNLGSQEQWGNF